MEEFKLRDDFLLGVATASAQVEGECYNNAWYEWTKNGDKTRDGTNSEHCNLHWRNYQANIKLLKDMHMEIYRMSLEWARVEPAKGVFDEAVMNRYIDEIRLLQSYGIRPLITLHHFSNPIWFEKMGGFLHKDAVKIFEEYVRYVVRKLRNVTHEYCTINEPNIYAISSYLTGEWLAQQKSMSKTRKVSKNLCKCHISAYKIIHEMDKEAVVGFAASVGCFYPKNSKNIFQKLEAKMFYRFFNNSYIEAMGFGKFFFPVGFLGHKKGRYYDYIGLNYYTRNEVKGFKYGPGEQFEHNNLGWSIYPEGIKELSAYYHKMFNADIWITENGTCDRDDAFRSKYIYNHLKMVSDLPYVKRYYHWC